MSNNELIIYLRHKKTEAPLLKVVNMQDQVVVAFLSLDGEHVTLHKQKDGSVLRTHYSKNKSRSWRDNARIDIANQLGYRDADRHGDYIIHDKLVKYENEHGYHLIERKINFYESISDKAKYQGFKKEVIDISHKNFTVILYLSTSDHPYIKSNPNFITSLGKIFLEIS